MHEVTSEDMPVLRDGVDFVRSLGSGTTVLKLHSARRLSAYAREMQQSRWPNLCH